METIPTDSPGPAADNPPASPGAFAGGLTTIEARRRLAAHGGNHPRLGRRFRALRLQLGQFTTPIILILIVAAAEWVKLAFYRRQV